MDIFKYPEYIIGFVTFLKESSIFVTYRLQNFNLTVNFTDNIYNHFNLSNQFLHNNNITHSYKHSQLKKI